MKKQNMRSESALVAVVTVLAALTGGCTPDAATLTDFIRDLALNATAAFLL